MDTDTERPDPEGSSAQNLRAAESSGSVTGEGLVNTKCSLMQILS